MPRKRRLGSRGIVTPRDALNSVRHGLSARTLAIPGLEKHGDWLKFRDAIVLSLAPEGELERELALCVAEGLWRRRRIARHEQHLIDIERKRDAVKDGWEDYKKKIDAMERRETATEPPAVAERVRNAARSHYRDLLVNMQIDRDIKPERMLPASDDLNRLIRYEAHISRQIYHALHELQALQAARRGEPAPLARLSVLGGT
jgi:hypothetical protein